MDIYLQLPSSQRGYCITYSPFGNERVHNHIKTLVQARFLGLKTDAATDLFLSLGPFVQMDQPDEVEIELWKADDSTIEGQDKILEAVFTLADKVGGYFIDIVKDSTEWKRLER